MPCNETKEEETPHDPSSHDSTSHDSGPHGFLASFKNICKHGFKGLEMESSVMFVFMIAIVAAVATIGFSFIIGQDQYNTLTQPSSEIAPWIVLITIALGIVVFAFSSYVLHTMTGGITRYTFMLTFLFTVLLITISFVALYLFASPTSSMYIALIAIVIMIWHAIFAGTISYVSAGLLIVTIFTVAFLFIVASRLADVN